MPIALPPLPYDTGALAPHLSRETLEFHYGKHHRKYVDTANQLIAGTELDALALPEMVQRATGKTFNNVAQAWNHEFFWNCLTPRPQEPDPALVRALMKAFGGMEDFRRVFTEAALGAFGSGWAWLVMEDGGGLAVVTTANAGTPLTEGRLPLLTCDVWEHAYYIDYRNDRARYLQHFWPLVNWEFVQAQLGATAPALRRGAAADPPRPGAR